MRVISGIYKGKKIQGFDIDGTRPTMDRIKESLFGIIQNSIQNSVCLDLFAGSGSLGIEALSNGAKKCYFIEKNKEVIKYLQNNLDNISNSFIINSDYLKAIENLEEKIDIVFLDPPYKFNLINKAIDNLIKNDKLNQNALIICEYEQEKILNNLELLKTKKYGDKYISIYRYK